MQIKTVGDIRKVIQNLPDDFMVSGCDTVGDSTPVSISVFNPAEEDSDAFSQWDKETQSMYPTLMISLE